MADASEHSWRTGSAWSSPWQQQAWLHQHFFGQCEFSNGAVEVTPDRTVKRCRPGKKRRDRFRIWQQRDKAFRNPAIDLTLEEKEAKLINEDVARLALFKYGTAQVDLPNLDPHNALASPLSPSQHVDTQEEISRGGGKSFDPLEPVVLSESEDGCELRSATYSGERRFSRGMPVDSVSDRSLHPLITRWLEGELLKDMVRFEKGRAGWTPRIVNGSLTEISNLAGVVSLEVNFADHGKFIYQRSCDAGMPVEQTPDGVRQTLRWLAKQRTYGSKSLDAPLPNRVAEWLEGRNLEPCAAPRLQPRRFFAFVTALSDLRDLKHLVATRIPLSLTVGFAGSIFVISLSLCAHLRRTYRL